MAASSLSIGLRFYYWRYYQTLKELPDEEDYNINDHSGHTVRALFVSAKYVSFGEEVANYKHIDLYGGLWCGTVSDNNNIFKTNRII